MYKQSIDLNAKSVLGDYVYSDAFLDKIRRDAYNRATYYLANHGYNPMTREGTAEALKAMQQNPKAWQAYNRYMNVVDKTTNTIFSRNNYPTGTDINTLYPGNARFYEYNPSRVQGTMRNVANQFASGTAVHSPELFAGNKMNSVLRKKLIDAYKGAKNTVFTRPLNNMSGLLKKLKGIRF